MGEMLHTTPLHLGLPLLFTLKGFLSSLLPFPKLDSQSCESLKDVPSRVGRVNSNSPWEVQDKKHWRETAQGSGVRKFGFYFELCLEHVALFRKIADVRAKIAHFVECLKNS